MAEPYLQDDVSRVLRDPDRFVPWRLRTRGYLLMSGALHLLAVAGLSLLPASHALRPLPTSDAIRVSLLGPEVAAEGQPAEEVMETPVPSLSSSPQASVTPPYPALTSPPKQVSGASLPRPSHVRTPASPKKESWKAPPVQNGDGPISEAPPEPIRSVEPQHPFLTQDRADTADPAGPLTTETTRIPSDGRGRPEAGGPLSVSERDGQQDSLQRTDFAPLAPPRVSYQVKPQYPLAARQRGIEGTVLLKAHVTEGGVVQDIAIERSTGHPELDRSAMEALGRWRFEPARRGNTAIATWVLVPVTFELD